MGSLLTIDKQLLLIINRGFSASFLDPLMILLSSSYLWVGVLLALTAYWSLKKNWQRAAMVVFAALLVAILDPILSQFVKPYVARLRPCRVWKDEVRIVFGCAGHFGFPSNHAANGMSVVASFFILGGRKLGMVALGATLLVGLSRVYLGVHYPLDVLGGFLVGALWGAVFSLVLRRNVALFGSKE